jgi:hypothetical protein
MNSRKRDGELINKPLGRMSKSRTHAKQPSNLVRAVQFQAVTFYDPAQQRQVIVLYALDETGVIREYANNAWKPYPIEE